MCRYEVCRRLESMVRANVSLAKERMIMDYFVELMDLAESHANFISM